MWTVTIPLKVPISKKKFFHLNLNQYRNAHYFTLDRAKKEFFKLMKDKLRGIPKLNKVHLEYVLYPGTDQICDTNNVCSIVDKFFSDTLVTMRVIDDDNYNFIAKSIFRFGCIDRVNPRVDVIIRSPDHIPLVPSESVQETEPMKIQTKTTTLITLTQADVEQALKDFLGKQIKLEENADVSIKETGEGFEIRIEQGELPEQLTLDMAPSKPTRRRKADRMEPKEAMAVLASKASESHTIVEDNEQAMIETDKPVQVAQETPPPAPAVKPSIFSAMKPVEVNTPTKKEESAPTPAPGTKGPGLFANYKRPSN